MRKLGLVLILLIAGAGIASAQFSQLPLDYNILGGGARAHGMGGAFIGLADDATATSWNPAGLAQLDRMEASAVGNFSSKKFTWKTDVTDPTYPVNNEDSSYSRSTSHIAPNFFSLAVPFKVSERNVVFAIAYQRLIDFGYDEEDETITYTWDYTVRGGMDAISPALAIQLTPNVMIGAAGNIILNGLTHKSEQTWIATTTTRSIERDYRESGFNINAGALVMVHKNMNVGATVRLPFTVTSKYTRTVEETGIATYDTTYPDQKTTYPLMIGFGFAFKPSDNLTITADYENRGYGRSKFTYQDYDGNGKLIDYTVSRGWRDINQYRVGLEYVAISSLAVFPLRLGFRTNPLVAADNKITSKYDRTINDYTNNDITGNTELVFTGGFGMKFGNIWLDLAYEMGKGNFYSDETEVSDGAEYNYYIKESTHNIIASCIFHF